MLSATLSIARRWSPALFAVLALGCQSPGLVGSIRPAHEACGNGMDDDDDDLIDEGCPCAEGEMQACFGGNYPHRLVGVCRDGLQHCDLAQGAEFGTWQHCMNDIEPLQERCTADGQSALGGQGALDEDCDGAIDEGCECELGQMQVCGEEFLSGLDLDRPSATCRAGTQTCLDNRRWSACVGAVGPGPELCIDGLDNDCDGEVDEGCDCMPSPEVCGDGVDNDCDGDTDEGCQTPPPCAVGELNWSRDYDASQQRSNRANEDVSGAWNGDGMVFILGSNAPILSHVSLVYDPEGVSSPPNLVGETDDISFLRTIVPVGGHLVAAYATGVRTADPISLRSLDLQGRPLSPPIVANAVRPVLASRQDAFVAASSAEVLRYDPDLTLIGTSALPPPRAGWANIVESAAWAGERWIVGGKSYDTTSGGGAGVGPIHFWILDEDEVERVVTASSTTDLSQTGSLQLVGGPEGALACWVQGDWFVSQDLFCQRFDQRGQEIGGAWRIAPRNATWLHRPLMTYWQNRYLVISPSGDTEDNWVGFIDGEGSEESIALPAQVLSGEMTGAVYFSYTFANHTSGPPEAPFMMLGGGSNSGDSRRALIQLSCP